MNIAWKYLDKRAAAVAALMDFSSMKFIIEHTDDEIKAAYEKMSGVGSVHYDGMPHTRNPHVLENRAISTIGEIDALKERYRQAAEYMAWFLPAWKELSDDERYVLETIYGKENEYGTNAIYDVCSHFNIERSSAYNKKNRALSHLVTLLFGKE